MREDSHGGSPKASLRLGGRIIAGLCLAASFAGPLPAQQPDTVPDTVTVRLPEIRVEATRLAGGGVPLSRIPYSAQVLEVDASDRADAATVADLLGELVGITTADQFGTPFQPDVRFRGFAVGPVVGYPQSVSVFVDGVRVNEPDASQVNFSLIPLHAIERVEVIRAPGGPFGRNTLAGAINFVTRSGRGDTDGTAAASGGSFGTGEAAGWAGGGAPGGFHYLASARYYRTDGWRELSESRLRQFYGKAGWRGARSDAWLSYTFADDHVEGPGSLPRSWLRGALPPELGAVEDPRRLQFTGFQGDFFEPTLHFVVLGAARDLGRGGNLQLNGFVRSNRFTQFNDNITEPNARGDTDILSRGATVQASLPAPGGARLTAGAEYVRNRVDIQIFEEPNPAFPDAGGMTEDVGTVEDNWAVFSHLWWPASSRVSFTGSLRYDYVFLPVTDRLDPENSGENTFRQLSGSAGVDVLLADGTSVFASYGRGFRAPVILEVSCADPEDPCPLPFELGADPPLDPVTTDTWQAGLRHEPSRALRAELVGYWAEVYDDLFNVVAPSSTRGYFRNLDRTRRQGMELSLRARPLPDWELRGGLALTRATFQTEALLASALLEDDDEEPASARFPDPEEEGEGGVEVEPGDRFALVPGVSAEGEVEYAPGPWRFGIEGAYVGSQYLVGDEGNEAEFGMLDPYLLFGGSIARTFGGLEVWLRADNLLDAEHETFGTISPNVRGPVEDPQPFLSPGLPRRLTAGVRWRF